jgi:hypothetical protein
MGHRLGGFVGLRLPPWPAPQDSTPLAPGEPGHGRFAPLDGLPRCALVSVGPPREGLGTVGVSEPLTGLGPQGLDGLPSPRSPLTGDAQTPLPPPPRSPGPLSPAPGSRARSRRGGPEAPSLPRRKTGQR